MTTSSRSLKYFLYLLLATLCVVGCGKGPSLSPQEPPSFGRFQINPTPVLKNGAWGAISNQFVSDFRVVEDTTGLPPRAYLWVGDGIHTALACADWDGAQWVPCKELILSPPLNGWDKDLTVRSSHISLPNGRGFAVYGGTGDDGQEHFGGLFSSSVYSNTWTRMYGGARPFLRNDAFFKDGFSSCGNGYLYVTPDDSVIHMFATCVRSKDGKIVVGHTTIAPSGDSDMVVISPMRTYLEPGNAGAWDEGWRGIGGIARDGRYFVISFTGNSKACCSENDGVNGGGLAITDDPTFSKTPTVAQNPVVTTDGIVLRIWSVQIVSQDGKWEIYLNATYNVTGQEEIFVADLV